MLSKLEVLHLGYNNFNNSILQSLNGIASLKELDLSCNNLNGSIHIKGKTLINLQRNIIGSVSCMLIEHVTFLISLLSINDIYATKIHPFFSLAILNESVYATEIPFFFHDFSCTFFLMWNLKSNTYFVWYVK